MTILLTGGAGAPSGAGYVQRFRLLAASFLPLVFNGIVRDTSSGV
jgi:hypothetical protein